MPSAALYPALPPIHTCCLSSIGWKVPKRAFGFDNFRILRMSYRLGPNEAWIALKRNRIAFARFRRLPPDLAEDAIDEFTRLVKANFIDQAVDIFTGPAWPERDLLLSRLEPCSRGSPIVFGCSAQSRLQCQGAGNCQRRISSSRWSIGKSKRYQKALDEKYFEQMLRTPRALLPFYDRYCSRRVQRARCCIAAVPAFRFLCDFDDDANSLEARTIFTGYDMGPVRRYYGDFGYDDARHGHRPARARHTFSITKIVKCIDSSIGSYLPVVLLSLATFAVGVVISVLIYRRSVAINTPRILLAGLFFAAVVAAGATYPRPGDDQSYHVIGHRTSSFFVSLKDMRFLVFKPAFVERLTSYSSDPGYQGLGECSQTKPRPDIVAVLMESAVPPSFYPAIKVGAELNNRFLVSRRRNSTVAGRNYRRRHLDHVGCSHDEFARC